ncbi:MAG: hypothetical protein HWD85_08530 [Flavobacteriaceae bacterium]|nr:hypothetical protein [Flavobacteriaceae bacterium]
MKKVALLLAFIFTVSAGFSQQRKRMHKADNLTPQQRTTLNVKRLVVALDLTKEQTNKIERLYTKMANKRMQHMQKNRKKNAVVKEKMLKIKKASKDRADFKKRVEIAIKNGELKKEDLQIARRRGVNFDTANRALDNRIELQSQMKKILTAEQYKKFKNLKKRRLAKTKKRKMAMKKRTEMKRKIEKKRHHAKKRRLERNR